MIASQEARDRVAHTYLYYQNWTYPIPEGQSQQYFRKSLRGLGAYEGGNSSQEGDSAYARRWSAVKGTFGIEREAWSVLDIQANASREQILAAWRRAMLEQHPDRNRGREALANQLAALATEAKDAMLLKYS